MSFESTLNIYWAGPTRDAGCCDVRLGRRERGKTREEEEERNGGDILFDLTS